MRLDKNELPRDKDIDDFFRRHTVRFNVGKEKEWARLQRSIGKQRVWKTAAFRYAAIFVILLSTALFMRFATTKVDCPNGEHLAYILPDSSAVHLNAGTQLCYRPYWWFVKREVHLNGEAFFEVNKGNRFVVASRQGKTTVLGTSFNIFARAGTYKVSCASGKVAVETGGKEYHLLPGQSLMSNPGQGQQEQSDNSLAGHLAWTQNRLAYNKEPLETVFEEFERQYNVTINYRPGENYLYSGNLDLNTGIEDNLRAICLTFGLGYFKDGPVSNYIIRKQP